MKLNRSFYSFHSGVFFNFPNTYDVGKISTQGIFEKYMYNTAVFFLLKITCKIGNFPVNCLNNI